MSDLYIGSSDTWHVEIARIVDGDLPTGDVASLPDRQNKDNANYLYRKAVQQTHWTRTTVGAGSINLGDTVNETQRIKAILVRACAGGQAGQDGYASHGGLGGVAGGYSERYITGFEVASPGVITYHIGEGGAANGGAGEDTWVDLGNWGVVFARGGGVSSAGVIVPVTTTNHTLLIGEAPATTFGLGFIPGAGGTAGVAGMRGEAHQLPGGAGGSSGGGTGKRGIGYGAGGGGGRNASGSAAGGGGGAGGWFTTVAAGAGGAGDADDSSAGVGGNGRVEITVWYDLAV